MNTLRAIGLGACAMGMLVVWGVNMLLHRDMLLSSIMIAFARVSRR